MTRTCGECTACCMTHEVIELEKPAGTACEYCMANKGCKVYKIRPLECATFKCQWLIGWGKESDRPDKGGIVVDYITDNPYFKPAVLILWEFHERSLTHEKVWGLTRGMLLNDTWVIHVYLSGQREIYRPPNLEMTPDLEAVFQRARLKMVQL